MKETYYSKMIDGTKWISGEGQFYAFDTNSFDNVRCQTIYAGTHEDGVMKSTDGGNTWSTIGLKGKRVSDIELVNINATTNVIYVATNDTASGGKGLYKITDSGKITVSAMGNLPDYPRTIAVDARDVNNLIIYACAGTSGAYKSTNGGNTFTRMNTGSSYQGLAHYTVEVSPSNPDRLYVGLHLTTKNNPLYSSDGGASWSAPTDLDVGNLTATGYSAYYSAPMAIHPANENIVLAYFKQTVMKTSNGGKTWVFSGNGYLGGRCTTNKTSAYFDKNDPNRIIYFLMDYGPFITYDKGQTWTRLPVPANGLRSTPVGVSIPDKPDIIITAVGTWGSQHIVRSVDAGETWKEFSYTAGDYKYMDVHPQDYNCIYAGSEEGSWRSDDAGASWKYISNRCVRVMHPGNGDILYATEAGTSNTSFWYSGDRGATWSKSASLPNKYVYDVDIDPLDPNVLYAASGNGLYAFDGASWSEIGRSNGLPGEKFGDTTYYTVRNVVVDDTSPNTIYAGMVYGSGKREQPIFKSTDYGSTWEDIGYDLPCPTTVWRLAVNPNTGDLHVSISHGNYVLAGQSPGASIDGNAAIYNFNEGSGVVATDTSGNGNDGTINGAVFSSGKSGTGLSFDGADDYVSIPSMNYDEISVTAWFYKNQNDTTNADAIFGGWKWNSDIQKNEGFDIRFYKTTPDTIDFCLITEDTSGTRKKMTASNNLGDSTGAWYHVACTYNQSTGEQKLYINGALVKTENHPAGNKITPLSTYSDMRVGHSRANKGYFNGKIDEVCIYNRALSDQEVQNLYSGN